MVWLIFPAMQVSYHGGWHRTRCGARENYEPILYNPVLKSAGTLKSSSSTFIVGQTIFEHSGSRAATLEMSQGPVPD